MKIPDSHDVTAAFCPRFLRSAHRGRVVLRIRRLDLGMAGRAQHPAVGDDAGGRSAVRDGDALVREELRVGGLSVLRREEL